MLPPHILPLLRLRSAGIHLRQAMQGGPMPRFKPTKRALLVVGDDPPPTQAHSLGPAGFDGVPLRAWFAGLPEGAPIGIFAGKPVASAYEAVCRVAQAKRGHGIIVECDDGTWCAWSAYASTNAPQATRLDVFPPSMQEAALAAIRTTGGTPMDVR